MTDIEKLVHALAWLLDECNTTTTEFPAVASEKKAMENASKVLDEIAPKIGGVS